MNRIILFVAISVLFVSCSSSRKINNAPVVSERAGALIEKMSENETDFHTFKAKFAVRVEAEDDKMDLHGQVRIANDSAIWLSLTKAGLEVYRFMVTPDSLFVLNRLGQQYAKDPVSSLNKMISSQVDFAMLQGLFTGDDFDGYDTEGFEAMIDKNMHRLNTMNRTKEMTAGNSEMRPVVIPSHTLWLNPETYRIEVSEIKEATAEGTRILTTNYDNFKEVEGMKIPHTINVDLKSEFNFNMKIEYTKVTVDENLKFPFSVSSKYQRISWK